MLTVKQLKVLNYINKKQMETGLSPSFEEIKKELNLKSKSSIHSIISKLDEKGFIKRKPKAARSLEIIKNKMKTNFLHINNEFTLPKSLKDSKSDFKLIAFYGKMNAKKLDINKNPLTTINIPMFLLDHNSINYAVEIEKNPYKDLNIIDGDTLIISKTKLIKNNDIIIAEFENKKKELCKVKMKNENLKVISNYNKKEFTLNEIFVHGKIVSLLRKC